MSERPQLLLPFAEREYIDTKRAMRILGVGWHGLARMAREGALELIEYRYHSWKRIRYQSIVDHCDRLRAKYAIPDRRPPLSNPIFRHRDDLLLPFPLKDTIMGHARLCRILGYASRDSVAKLMEAGCFEAYQLMPASEWRISRSSFEAYVARVMPRALASGMGSEADDAVAVSG